MVLTLARYGMPHLWTSVILNYIAIICMLEEFEFQCFTGNKNFITELYNFKEKHVRLLNCLFVLKNP